MNGPHGSSQLRSRKISKVLIKGLSINNLPSNVLILNSYEILIREVSLSSYKAL